MYKVLRGILHVLTCLVVVLLLPVHGQNTCCPTDSCCDISCAAPPPYNITIEEWVSLQPLYVVFRPAVPAEAGIDNTCYTFIPLPDGTYLQNNIRIYTKRWSLTRTYTFTQLEPGVFISGSASCNQQYTIFDYFQTDECSVYLVYFCFNYGGAGCFSSVGNSIPVMGFSPNNTRISQNCLNYATDLIGRAGIATQDYFIEPMQLESGCITQVNCTVPS